MLDRIDSGLDRKPGRGIAMRVGGNLASPLMGLTDRGLEFGARELGDIDRVIGKDAARCADLDDVCAPF